MKKIVYSLSTCDTCRRILKSINSDNSFEVHDIKKTPLSPEIIDQLAQQIGSYEALFNRQAQLYKTLDLKNAQLTEQQYRQYLLTEYTLLKRPVVVVGEKIFVGNAKANLDALQNYLQYD